MARTPLYSRSPLRPHRASGSGTTGSAAADTGATGPAEATDASVAPRPGLRQRGMRALRRHERWVWAGAGLLLVLLAAAPRWSGEAQRIPTMQQIDAAMRESIAKEPLASAEAAAYAAVLPSVVRVVGERVAPPSDAASAGKPKTTPGPAKRGQRSAGASPHAEPDDDGDGRSVGTGVVIVDKGLILTNLHVIDGANKITVMFADGSESEAAVVALQAKDDLAVLQAKVVPDDLQAATMRSTGGLSPGDRVVAVGFPFGIGPSASGGVISGLKRDFRSPAGQRLLTNLIQFDAAANPGNSGGPLVTLDGHVIGIVTAIMNPNRQRTFIGIGFAVPIENAAAAAGLPPF